MNYEKIQIDDTILYKVTGDYIGNKVAMWSEKDLLSREGEVQRVLNNVPSLESEMLDISETKSSTPIQGTEEDRLLAQSYGINI